MPLRVCTLLFRLSVCALATGQNAGRGNRGPAKKVESVPGRSKASQPLQRQIGRRPAGQLQSSGRQVERTNQQINRLDSIARHLDRRESVGGLNPQELRRDAKEHANLHAQLASGLQTGRPLRLDDADRQAVAEIFGDADRLDPRPRSSKGNPHVESGDSKKPEVTERRGPQPGLDANPRARLANAIRVRRAQISELRDRAIETGDESLLERADRFEQKLDLFLHNQERVEANLGSVRDRIATRNSIDSESGFDGTPGDTAENVQLKDDVSALLDSSIDEPEMINEVQD